MDGIVISVVRQRLRPYVSGAKKNQLRAASVLRAPGQLDERLIR
jgi:hypothetical protein